MSRRLLPLALFLLAAPAAFAQDPTVATVNGEEIKASEYHHRLEYFHFDRNSMFAAAPAGFQVLRQMISERIIFGMAKAKGIAPTAPEIDARVAELYLENPNLKAEMAQAGTSEADLRAQVRNQEAQFKLVTSGVTITDQEIENYYKNSPVDFEIPKQYKLRIIAVNDDPTQKAVDDALKAGQTFAAVAKQFSLDPGTRDNGGEYGTVTETSLAEDTRKAIGVAPAGTATAWVVAPQTRLPDGTLNPVKTRVRFFVESIVPGSKLPLDATLKPRIRRRLMLQKGSKTVARDLETATQAAKVTIADPTFQATYASLLAQSRKAQG